MFKKHKVVMLPTDKPSRLFIVNDKELYNNGKLAGTDTEVSTGSNYINQHLYILSDEEISQPCWAYHKLKNIIYWIAESNIINGLQKNNWVKIIASTDESLGLPRPSDSFIKRYCEVGGIDEVMVEYEIGCTGWGYCDGKAKGYYCYKDCSNFKLKVAPDNTITIKKVKDSWNREDLPDLKEISRRMNRARNILQRDGGQWNMLDTTELDKWIEENL